MAHSGRTPACMGALRAQSGRTPGALRPALAHSGRVLASSAPDSGFTLVAPTCLHEVSFSLCLSSWIVFFLPHGGIPSEASDGSPKSIQICTDSFSLKKWSSSSCLSAWIFFSAPRKEDPFRNRRCPLPSNPSKSACSCASRRILHCDIVS